jgi:hypothetical protein
MQCFSKCGLRLFARWSSGGFGKKALQKLYQTLYKCMHSVQCTPALVCAKIDSVGWPSTKSSSFHNFLSFNHYFRKYFKLIYRKNLVMLTLTAGVMVPIHVHALLVGVVVCVCPDRLMKWSAIAENLRNTHLMNVAGVRYSLLASVECHHQLWTRVVWSYRPTLMRSV